MPEQEFEQFLTMLRGVLRLDSQQRDDIAAELRDHLEERLADLSAQGVPHRQAVHLALEEFGDAAGLAAQFALVLSAQRRRKIMKWTVCSATGLLVACVMTYAFWTPATPLTPAPRLAIAQDAARSDAEPGSEPGAEPAGERAKKRSRPGTSAVARPDAVAATETRLAEKAAASYDAVPLLDFLEHVTTAAGVDVYLDKTAIDDEGISLDSLVVANFKEIRRDQLLDLVLHEYGLAWVARDGYLFVTTRQKLENTVETRVYNCRDLVGLAPLQASIQQGGMSAMGGMGMSGMGGMGMGGMMPGAAGAETGMMSGMMGSDAGMGLGVPSGGMMPGGYPGGSEVPYTSTLIEVITTTVLPESWVDQGGLGSIAAYHGGLLVVNHHPQAHQRIEQLLQMLRDAAREQPGAVVRSR